MKHSDHVELLGVLFVVWGLMTIVIGLSTLALGLGTAVMALTPGGPARDMAASVTATIFMSLGCLALGWGMVHVIIGRGLRKRRPRARLAALVLGLVDLPILPFGTALGVYTLWVLLAIWGHMKAVDATTG